MKSTTKLIQFYIELLPDWALFSIFVLTSLILMALVKKLIFSRLLKLSFFNKWGGEAIVKRLSAPAWLLIFAITIQLGGKLVDLKKSWQEALGQASLVLFSIAFILVLNRFLTILFESFAEKYQGVSRGQGFGKTLIQVGVWAIGLMILMDSLGISITPLVASLGIGSVAAGLALQDTLSNLFSGFYLMVDRPVRVGDFIRLENNMEGFVDVIGWRSTRVRLVNSNLLVIPNSKIASSTFVNFNLPSSEMTFVVPLAVSYESDLDKVENVVLDESVKLLTEVPGGVTNFEPLVRYSSFGDSSISFNVILKCREFVDQNLLRHEMIKRIHRRFQVEGIEIPFPQRVVQIKNEP